MVKAKGSVKIGAHVPTSGGMATRSIEYALTIKAEAIQVFASSPRTWATSTPNPQMDEKFREKTTEHDIEPYVHASFLINLGSPTQSTYENSLSATAYSLKRGREIGAKGVVVHTGSAVDESHVVNAWKQIHEGVMPILNNLKDDDPWLPLVKKLDDLTKYFEALEWHPKVGVCLDTCHVFAAGHDIKKPGGMKETLDLLVEIVGLERIQLIHANDSMDICGNLKDRHQNLGKGEIGIEPFAELLAHPVVAKAPLILETPGAELEHGSEVKLLKSMRDKK